MKTKKYYQSLTMGNLVETITGKKGVIYQVFESLFKYHTLDLRWRIYYDYEDISTEKLSKKIDDLIELTNKIIKGIK